jgi:hypothetical protein
MWEDRQSQRIATGAAVNVYVDGSRAAEGAARNVSLDGLFVAAGPTDISRDDYVELEFRSRGGNRVYRFSAMVVYTSDEGVGLTVERDDRRAAEAIRALLGPGRDVNALRRPSDQE